MFIIERRMRKKSIPQIPFLQSKTHIRSNTVDKNIKDKQMLRYLFSINKKYFESKVLIDDDCSPKNTKLLIPTNFQKNYRSSDFRQIDMNLNSPRIQFSYETLPSKGFFPGSKTERQTMSTKV